MSFTSHVNGYQGQLDQDQVAIREVSRVLDLNKKLQALLFQFRTSNGNGVIQMHDLAQSLFVETFQSLNHALSIMKSSNTKIDIKPEINLVLPNGIVSPPYSGHGSTVSFDSDRRIASREYKRRRAVDYSWTNVTSVPYDDGFQWRKYGEKFINGSNFSRNYFRCTYKDELNCQATKLVQQKNNNDPPLFEVKYANKHTCDNRKQIITAQPASPPCAKSYISVENYNGNDQIIYMQDCTYIMAQLSASRPSFSNEDNLSAIPSGGSMVPISPREWDIDSMLMELGGFEVDDCFLHRSFKSL